MANGYHFTLSLGHALWDELLRAALPVRIQEGQFDLLRDVHAGVRQLAVRERVRGLIEDRSPPAPLMAAGRRARALWNRGKPALKRSLSDVVAIRGTWKVELDDAGTGFEYGDNRIGANAWLKGTAEGTVWLMRENVEVPFVISRRIGARIALDDVHYSDAHRAVVGTLRDLGLNVGDNVIAELLARVGERLLEQQVMGVNPVPILRREQVDELVGPMVSPLNMNMAVEELRLEVTGQDLTLKLKFGFTHRQLEGATR